MSAKLILLVPVILLLAVPAWTARDPSPRRGLRRALLFMFLFNLAGLFALRVVLPRVQ